MGFKSFFAKIGHGLSVGVHKAAKLAQDAGLTDIILAEAVKWVKVANGKYVDNDARREWAVSTLKSKGVPEGVARIATELAVKAVKAEIAKLP